MKKSKKKMNKFRSPKFINNNNKKKKNFAHFKIINYFQINKIRLKKEKTCYNFYLFFYLRY